MRHIELSWEGQTISVTYSNRCYHFRRRGTSFYLSVVDLLDSDHSVEGELVNPPKPVIRELRDHNVSVVR